MEFSAFQYGEKLNVQFKLKVSGLIIIWFKGIIWLTSLIINYINIVINIECTFLVSRNIIFKFTPIFKNSKITSIIYRLERISYPKSLYPKSIFTSSTRRNTYKNYIIVKQINSSPLSGSCNLMIKFKYVESIELI